MNLDSVVVHCEHISLPGQLGVAVGRATNISGLQVIGLKKYHCKSQPTKVRKFYEDISNTVSREDLTCCCSSFDSFWDRDTDNSDIGDSDKDEIIGDIDIEKSVSMINDHDSSFSENDEDLVQLIDDMSHESSDKLRFANVRDEIVCSSLSEFIHTPSENLATGFDILITKTLPRLMSGSPINIHA
jgi:hypothetical protein